MNIPIEFVIQCLPQKLRDFIINASLKNYHYSTPLIFIETNEKGIIEKLLYAVDWGILQPFMHKEKNVWKSTRREIISSYLETFNPTLFDVVVIINEMYKNEEMVKSLNNLQKVRETVSSRILHTVPLQEANKLENLDTVPLQETNKLEDNKDKYNDSSHHNSDVWEWHIYDGESYYGEHPECNIPDRD